MLTCGMTAHSCIALGCSKAPRHRVLPQAQLPERDRPGAPPRGAPQKVRPAPRNLTRPLMAMRAQAALAGPQGRHRRADRDGRAEEGGREPERPVRAAPDAPVHGRNVRLRYFVCSLRRSRGVPQVCGRAGLGGRARPDGGAAAGVRRREPRGRAPRGRAGARERDQRVCEHGRCRVGPF